MMLFLMVFKNVCHDQPGSSSLHQVESHGPETANRKETMFSRNRFSIASTERCCIYCIHIFAHLSFYLYLYLYLYL